jgi:hypothetical protein
LWHVPRMPRRQWPRRRRRGRRRRSSSSPFRTDGGAWILAGEVVRDGSLLVGRVLFSLMIHRCLEQGYIGRGSWTRVVRSSFRMIALFVTLGWLNGGWRT